jgi:hypothetical protein
MGFFDQSFRLCIKPSVDSRSILFHAHDDEDFMSILGRLIEIHPELWSNDIVYYFYVDVGGLYHTLESPKWLKGKL